MMTKEKTLPLGIYLHIPFCIKKCAYCDFLSAPAKEETRKEYLQALLLSCRQQKKWLCREQEKGRTYTVSSIFLGGGTPSLLLGEEIEQVLLEIQETFPSISDEIEISLEANPGTVDKKKLDCYKRSGINRISLGLQSTIDAELRELGRIHTYEEFLESFYSVREAGFCNINIDLMAGLPGQSLSSYEKTLKRVIELQPEHISSYSLILEEGTLFYEKYKKHNKTATLTLPEEETERAMYQMTEKELNRAGYFRYEISNYAKPGFCCKHNLCYWKRTPYLGLGLGASSFIAETRWKNEENLTEYIKNTKEEKEIRREETFLTLSDQMAETMFLGLRLIEGVRKKEFFEKFGVSLFEVYGNVIEKQKKLGLLRETKETICLTSFGIDVSNQVFYEYLLD